MIEPFRRVLEELEGTFRRLEAQIPPPIKVPYKDGVKLRYQEKTPQQAMVQKFARMISGLHALVLLSEHGFCQEQGVIQRTLDDIGEDMLFITLGLSTGQWTENHEKYLEYFWMDEPGAGMVKRDKIRAYVHQTDGNDDPSTGIHAGKAIFKGYSSFVHANSTAVVDMCAGDPPRYHLSGMIDNPLYWDHQDDLWNYFYRGLFSSVIIAKAFEDGELWAERYRSFKSFEAAFPEKVFAA